MCAACLQSCWRRKQTPECPVCQSPSVGKRPPRDRALKNLCEAVTLERDRGFRPVDEAAKERKEELRKSLERLQEKLKLFQEAKGRCDQAEELIEVRARLTERQIKKQFKKLHWFLEEEEEARIAALREEEEQKREAMKEKMAALSRDAAALSDTIRATEKELRAEDASFLQNHVSVAARVRRRLLLRDPPPLSGARIDALKHLRNLTFNVCNKMTEANPSFPVILDPNSAHPNLVLSEDLPGVRCRERRELPEHPESFDSSRFVLGSEGFESGSVSWEVEVRDS